MAKYFREMTQKEQITCLFTKVNELNKSIKNLNHNSTLLKQGGNSVLDEYFHLSLDQYNGLDELLQAGPFPGIPTAQQVFEQGSTVVLTNPIQDISFTALTSGTGVQKKNTTLKLNTGTVNIYNEALGYDSFPTTSTVINSQASNGVANITLSSSSGVLSKRITIDTTTQGIELHDQINMIGFITADDYSDNQILDDNALTSTLAVKKLITDNVDLSNFVKLTGESSQTIEGLVNLISGTILNSPEDANDIVNKAYVDALIVGLVRLAGDWDASTGTFPTVGTGTGGAIRRGDSYIVNVAGTIAGQVYDIGDTFYAKTNNPGQTASNWGRFEVPAGQATSVLAGIMKLYTATGAATDGTMTQASITNALALKANLASPALTGTPTAPTALTGTNTTQIATTAFVQAGLNTMTLDKVLANGNSASNKTAIFVGTPISTQAGIGSFGLELQNGTFRAQYYIDRINNNSTNPFYIINDNASPTANILEFRKGTGPSIAGFRYDGRAWGTDATANNDFVTLQQLTSASSAVIAQTITDGVTTSAPSQDAVYDALFLKADLNSPNFTGIPTALTAAFGTVTNQIANTIFVQNAINTKQDTLVSGSNIKTVGGQTLLGSGNVTEVQNSLTASTILAPSVTAVNTALALKADDSSVVHRTGNLPETVTGAKTFTSSVGVTGNGLGYLLGNAGNNASILYNSNGNLDITPRSTFHTTFTAGNVLIGSSTATPAQKLQVDGAVQIGLGAVNAGGTSLNIKNDSGKIWRLVSGAPAVNENYFSIINSTDSVVAATVTNVGNWGFGTVNPIAKQHTFNDMAVSGSTYAGYFGSTRSALSAQGDATLTQATDYLLNVGKCTSPSGGSGQTTFALNVRGSGSVVMGSTSDTGEQLQVYGTGKFTGIVTGPTAAAGTSTTQLATTAFVTSALTALVKTGTSTQSGNGSVTSFNIAHGLGVTPGYFSVNATSSAAANISYVTANATNITVFYAVAPVTGTNNLSWNWITK